MSSLLVVLSPATVEPGNHGLKPPKLAVSIILPSLHLRDDLTAAQKSEHYEVSCLIFELDIFYCSRFKLMLFSAMCMLMYAMCLFFGF